MKIILFPAVIMMIAIAVKGQSNRPVPNDTIRMNDVVITGQYKPQSLQNAVQRVRVISRERIASRGATNVLTVLNTELGVRFSNDLTLGETDLQLMGVSGENVKVLFDGIPLVDRGATKQSLSQVDINAIERIELVEGPMSVIYGTDALAGVVNIITKKATTGGSLGVTARLQEETMGKQYSGFDNKGIHNGSLAANFATGKWEFSAAGTRNNSGSFENWKAKDQWLANGRAGYRTEKIAAWYRLDHLDENIKSPGITNQVTNKSTDKEYLTGRYTHQLQLEWQPDTKLSVNAAASYQDYTRRTLTTDIDYSTGKRTLNLDAGAQDISSFESKFLRGTLQYKLSEAVSFQPGFDIKLDRASGQRISGSPQINDYSFFGTSEINLKSAGFITAIRLKPGLRFSMNSIYNAPPVIPSLSTRFTFPGNFDLRLSYAKGFRSPALRELYFNFFDASHSIRGNENLNAERSDSYTGALSWQIAYTRKIAMTSTFSGFYNTFRDRITYGTDPDDPTVSITVNNDHYETTGFSIDNTLKSAHAEVSAGLSYTGRYNIYHENNSSTGRFNWSPELNGNLLYHFAGSGTSVSMAWKYSGKLPGYQVATTGGSRQLVQTETGSFNLADAAITRRFSGLISITGGIRNLFNVTALNNTFADNGVHSSGGSVPVSYGRSFFLGLNLQWNKK